MNLDWKEGRHGEPNDSGIDGVLGHSLVRLLAPLTRLLAPDYSLQSRPPAALTRLLARSLRSLPRLWESELLMSQNVLVLSHSAV